jgi:hypothetical protein
LLLLICLLRLLLNLARGSSPLLPYSQHLVAVALADWVIKGGLV